MKSRHKAREIALQILYRYEVATASGGTVPLASALAEDITRHFEHFQAPEGIRSYAAQLVAGSLLQQRLLDEVLEKHAANWKISRMALVDRSLLRLAAYEMLYVNDVPLTVVIDEAVELAKEFGTSDTPAFVNGILDAVRGSIQSGALLRAESSQ